MKNATAFHTVTPAEMTAECTVEDRLETPAFYHCRVTLADGHLAVCSPVWLG
jgi:hypothetical protein